MFLSVRYFHRDMDTSCKNMNENVISISHHFGGHVPERGTEKTGREGEKEHWV